jgi:hypothetical protein
MWKELILSGRLVMSSNFRTSNKASFSRRNVLLASTTVATASALSSTAPIESALAQVTPSPRRASDIEGQATIGGAPLAGSTVTLWAANANAPRQLAQARTGVDGHFALSAGGDGAVLYVVAKGGQVSGGRSSGEDSAIALLAVLGGNPPAKIVINELTTVASTFVAARFIKGEAISGDPLGLRIAAGNVPNLVDLTTGSWGKVVLDPINITQNTTLANLNTLGSLITAFISVTNDDWRGRFLKAANTEQGTTLNSTLEAMTNIARRPWVNAGMLYALFDEAYPQQSDGGRRKAPFLPYLAYAPPDFALMLCFAGGGVCAAGKFMFDADGNLWSGVNWMPGSQSGVTHGIGGGTIKFSPNGTALSPAVTGFTGMGVDGVGWGTGVTLDKVWVTSFNGKIGLFDFDGRSIGNESDFPMAGKVGGLQGVGVAANGDVWIADATKNQMLYFPGGRVKDGRLVQVKGLKSPFGVAIDAQNRVWVSNAQSDTVVRFPADDPSKAQSFRAGIAVRGIALDSKSNLWVASNLSLDAPPPKIPDGVSIMRQFQLAGEHMIKALAGRTTGAVNMIRPDGTQPAPMGFTGNGINVPWGVSIDGNDDVWLANFWGRGVVLMAGDESKDHSQGRKTGDVVHVFTGGTIQMPTDVVIDPAGNVWATNNWNNPEAAVYDKVNHAISTWGGGSGFTVIYGVAAPVKAPLMGPVRTI